MKKSKKLLATLIAAMTAVSQIVPAIKVQAATDSIRLATFNIAANKKPDVAKLNELLKNNQVNVVGLQEVDVNTTRNPYDMLEKFVEQGDYEYSHFQKAIDMKDGVGEYGIGLLSNLELSNSTGGSLNSEGIKEARAWQKSDIEFNGKVIAVYNAHLTHESVDARAKQLLELKQTIDQDPTEYKVAFGDFNVDQSHDEIYPFLEDYNIANGKDGKWYDTYNGVDASMKTNAIDNIITSRNMEISHITMVETTLSDHNMLYADAKLLDHDVTSREYLDLVIKQANDLDEDQYSNATYKVLDEKLTAGELLDENASQEQINQAIKDIQDAQENLKVKYENLALNKNVSVSGLEVNDGRFTAPMAVDGVVSKESRVSFAKDKDEQWLLVDLGGRKTVSEFVINYESCPPAFKIQVSTDGIHYKDVYKEENLADGGPSAVKEIQIDATKARYVKYVQLKRWKHSGNGKYYSGSIYEFEVYKERNHATASEVLKAASKEAPQIDGNKLVLPTVPEGFEISLYGCDNKQVVTMDGTVIQPLEDMNVNVLYQVKNLKDDSDVATSEEDIKFVVPGKYSKEESINAKPNVMPGLREWKGNEGEFTLTKDSKIVVKDESLKATAKQIQFYLKEMVKKNLAIVSSGETTGDIVLTKDSSLDVLGKEGYTLDINDLIEIKSNYETGILYGGISITQILSQDEGKNNIAKGIARDYPKYEVRAGMLDVARTYIPMDYLKEMTIYMAYYKLNEVQVHVNDYWGATGYSAFRLESTTYPMITSTDGSYTKEEYKNYQKEMKNYGIDVITEIDTPYHAECFRSIPGAKMLKTGALDIREQSSYDIIENLIDEYLDGDDPVIESDKFHIGTDEYDKNYSEQMRKWTDHFIKYVNNKGYKTRLWGSLGSRGFNGTTPVSNDATVNLWAPYWADVKETYASGYDIINTCGGWLYIVPGANAGYPDRLNISTLYDKFDVNNFSPSRNAGQGTAIMPVAHPQTKGAQFCIWNDMTSYGGGFTWFDIYDRFKDAVMITSEKTWYGEKTDGQTAAQFVERVNKLNSVVPGANPGRVVESADKNVTTIDFESVKDNKAIDLSKNGYDATLKNVTIEKGNGGHVATLNGNGYVSLPYQTIGYPYTVMMDVKLDSNTPENTEIFSGSDGVMYANVDGTGKIGYKRSGYTFTFDYELPKDKWFNLALTCDQKNTTLYINGKAISTGINMKTAINNRKDSSTFVLPVEKILNNAKGSVDNIKIYNQVSSASEIADELGYISLENLALHKNATASSVYPGSNKTPDLAVDGDNSKSADNRWSSKRATGNGSNEDSGQHGTKEQYLTVDLGDVYKVDKVFISWEGAYATNYTIQGSLDGENFFDIKVVDDGKGGEETHDDLGNKETRYIRILCRQAKTANYGYSIYELEVYQSANEELRKLAQAGKDQLSQFEVGNKNGNIAKKDYEELEKAYKDYLDLAQGEKISDEEIGRLLKEVTELNSSIESYVIYSKDELNDLYQAMKAYKEKDYTKDSFVGFDDQLNALKEVIDQADDYQKVNDALKQLKELNSTLVKLDRSKLEKIIKEYQELKEEDYTVDSWQQMKEVLDAAQAVYNNSSLNQEDIDQAVASFDGVQLVQRGNVEKLEELLSSIKESDYTVASWSQFDSIYQEAKQMVNDSCNVDQKAVDEMIEKVKDAMELLVKAGNIDDYQDAVDKVSDKVGQLDQSKYTKESWDKLQETLQKAKDLATKEDVSQEELDNMLASLNDAYDALKEAKTDSVITDTDTNDKTNTTDKNTTKTGDDVSLFGYVGLLCIALLGFVYSKRFE